MPNGEREKREEWYEQWPEWIPKWAKWPWGQGQQPSKAYAPPTALSYTEFSQLDPAEQERILRTPSGVGLPNLEGTGYRFEWGFTPETGQMWQLKEIPGEEKAPWQTPAFPTTRQAGGYTFMPQYDLEGNIIGWDPIGRAPEAPEEPIEPKVIRERGLTGEELRSMSLEFELWKSQALQDSSIAGPSGWIRRYMIEQIQDPFSYERQRAAHRKKVIRAGGEEKEAARFAERAKAEGGAMWQGERERVSPEQAAGYAKYRRRETSRVGRGGPERPRAPTLPPTPATLAQFVPGLVTGEPITKEQVITPSGQQWMASPWSQREQLRGYTEWAGGRPYQDILDQMRMMIPEAPAGVAKKWYRPPRQV